MSMNKYARLAPPRRHSPSLVRMHDGKRRWKTLKDATATRDSAAARYGAEFSAYYCPVCEGFHIGHRRAS